MTDQLAASSFLEARSLSYRYTPGKPVLEQVDAAIVPGSFLAILGVNGSGKSTLLSCLDDILRPQGGVVLLDGKSLHECKRDERARHIAFVAQHSHAARLTVFDVLMLGRLPHSGMTPLPSDEHIVNDVIARMGLDGYALRYVDELSGGEYQKVILARAFVQQTSILLLDEPTNNLDPANQQEVMALVRDQVDTYQLAAAAVMHDINLALRYCDRFLMIANGRVLCVGDEQVITQESIKAVYGIEADIIEHGGRRVVIPR